MAVAGFEASPNRGNQARVSLPRLRRKPKLTLTIPRVVATTQAMRSLLINRPLPVSVSGGIHLSRPHGSALLLAAQRHQLAGDRELVPQFAQLGLSCPASGLGLNLNVLDQVLEVVAHMC
jgi:hypothetical protein